MSLITVRTDINWFFSLDFRIFLKEHGIYGNLGLSINSYTQVLPYIKLEKDFKIKYIEYTYNSKYNMLQNDLLVIMLRYGTITIEDAFKKWNVIYF